MPSIRRKICTKHGIYTTSRCELCKQESAKIYNDTARDKESDSFYHTTRWRKLRAKQLSLHPLCINFDVCGNVATIADHAVEVKDGGAKFSLDNLQSMCQSCHNTKTTQERKKRYGIA